MVTILPSQVAKGLQERIKPGDLVGLDPDVDLSDDGAGVVVQRSHEVHAVRAAVFGPTHFLAIDGDDPGVDLGLHPCAQGLVEGFGIQPGQDALEGGDVRCRVSGGAQRAGGGIG